MKTFSISLFYLFTIVPTITFADEIAPPSPPCSGSITTQGCQMVNSAIGILSTQPEQFVLRLFTFLLSISGGIAVLMFISSGITFMTSQGNADAIKGAQETIISVIAGLLFIIFSFVILQIIGSDILHIPGFS